jgi:protein-S-isoprenylcysteine O-methyltransferase Ste14
MVPSGKLGQRGVLALVRGAKRLPHGGKGSQLKLNLITLAVVVTALLLFGMQAARFPLNGARVAGLALAIPSFLLFALARLQLGRAFSVQAKATTLVTIGLYARIRNPIYVFGGLTIAGVIIWAERPWLLLVFAVLIPLQIYRSRKEERVLTEKFGAAYLKYKQKTWF